MAECTFKLKNNQYTELIFVIDEIQKIPNWSEVVKGNRNGDKIKKINTKLVLPESSKLLIQKRLTELLAGRFENIYIGTGVFLR